MIRGELREKEQVGPDNDWPQCSAWSTGDLFLYIGNQTTK